MNKQPRILVVDDTPMNSKLLFDVLTVRGYDVSIADSGPDALKQIERHVPDLVLLDVLMPDMDGYEVCTKIRKNPRTATLPVVMVTALDANCERIKGIEVGADDFLTKPVSHPELIARVRSLLRIKTLHEEQAKLAEVGRLLGDISHEVKNILMPVISGVSMLKEELHDVFTMLNKVRKSEDLCNEILVMVDSASRRLQKQTEEIANCVKGVSAAPQFAPCSVATIVQEVFRTLRVTAEGKQISLVAENLETLPTLSADERRLYSVFHNLVNNALADTPQGGSITIRRRNETDVGSVHLSVVDSGRGMPKNVLDSLFTTSTISCKKGGTGFGTKIVKDAVDAHGGTINVESQEGIGTSFHLSLPLSPPCI